jgi:DNA-binding GntR family transcriptional regulator
VRAALKVLEQYGLIKRTPHVGTEVIASGTIHSFDQQLATFSDLNQLASQNQRKIKDIREVVISWNL